MAIISLLRDAANKIRRKPASEAKKTLSPFAKVKHLSAEYLSHLHVIEMKKAYRVSNPKPDVCEVKCDEEHDRWNGSFRHQYIDTPEPRRPTNLIEVEFAARQSLCYGSKPDLEAMFPALSTYVSGASMSSSSTESTGTLPSSASASPSCSPAVLPESDSWVPFQHSSSIAGEVMNASSSFSTIASTPEELPRTVSWVSFKFAESRETSRTVSVHPAASLADIIERAEPIPSAPQAHLQPTAPLRIVKKSVEVTKSNSFEKSNAEEHKKMELSMSTTPDAGISISTSTSFRNWRRAAGLRMAMARIGDSPNTVMEDMPARFEGVDRSAMHRAPASIPSLSLSGSHQRWLDAEGSRVAKAHLGDDRNTERADIPLRLKPTHSALVASRRREEAYLEIANYKVSVLETHLATLKQNAARDYANVPSPVSTALSGVPARVSAGVRPPVTDNVNSSRPASVTGLIGRVQRLPVTKAPVDAPPVQRSPVAGPSKVIRAVSIKESSITSNSKISRSASVTGPIGRVKRLSANKISVAAPPVQKAPIAVPSKVFRTGGVIGPIGNAPRLSQRQFTKVNTSPAAPAAPKSILAQRRPHVLKDKENITSPALLAPSAPKGHKRSFALARRPLLLIIPLPSTGPRRLSRGFLP